MPSFEIARIGISLLEIEANTLEQALDQAPSLDFSSEINCEYYEADSFSIIEEPKKVQSRPFETKEELKAALGEDGRLTTTVPIDFDDLMGQGSMDHLNDFVESLIIGDKVFAVLSDLSYKPVYCANDEVYVQVDCLPDFMDEENFGDEDEFSDEEE